jgi:hypothetical protein
MKKRQGNRILVVGIILIILVIITLIAVSFFLPEKKSKSPHVFPVMPQDSTLPLPDELPDKGCIGSWLSDRPCNNAFDGEITTAAQPAAGTDAYVYEKFEISKNSEKVILTAYGKGESANGYDCGYRVYYYNYSSSKYVLLVNDTSGYPISHSFVLANKDMESGSNNYLLSIIIKGGYYVGSCGTWINETEIQNMN